MRDGRTAKLLRASRDEILGQVDVRVAQQRREIVRGRSHARVLEVDPEEIAPLHHEVAAVVVAMAEDARPGGDLRGQTLELPVERGTIDRVDRHTAMALDEVLDEILQLPPELLGVEGDLEAGC